MSKAVRSVTRTGIRRVAVGCVAVVAALALTAAQSMATTLALTTAPTLPTLTGVTLNGQSQNTLTTWSNAMKITSSGTNTGWNLTVNSASGVGKSAVFKQYCPNTTCGTDTAPDMSPADLRFPADSLTLNSGAELAGRPRHPGRHISAASARSARSTDYGDKVVSASTTWRSATWTGRVRPMLSLATPASLRKLQTGEVYRVNVVWTLSSGP